MLTEKENYLMTLRGEVPEWVPRNMYASPGHPPDTGMAMPSIMFGEMTPTGRKDIWGVEFVATKETGGMALPVPGKFLLDDITKWRDVIKAPDISGIDWEGMIKKQLDQYESMGCTRETTAISLDLHFGFFMDLVSFMGFENGMIAMSEEPEEVHALLDYLCTFFESVADKVVPILNPDIIALADDVCSWRAPFVSEAMWRGHGADPVLERYRRRPLEPRSDQQRSGRGKGQIRQQYGHSGRLRRTRPSAGGRCHRRGAAQCRARHHQPPCPRRRVLLERHDHGPARRRAHRLEKRHHPGRSQKALRRLLQMIVRGIP